jgi:hypothetical protein
MGERAATQAWTLRDAALDDVKTIADIWHRGWRDGHLGHVPEALLPHRRLEHFRARVPPRIPATTVAVTDGELVGFVTIHDDEVEQLFVDLQARRVMRSRPPMYGRSASGTTTDPSCCW